MQKRGHSFPKRGHYMLKNDHCIVTVGVKGLEMNIGPWALSDDV